jgi:hypothetical protein
VERPAAVTEERPAAVTVERPGFAGALPRDKGGLGGPSRPPI